MADQAAQIAPSVYVRTARDPAAALQRLGPAVRYAVDGADVQALTDGCTLLDVVAGDAVTGCIAVQVADGEAWVTAAADTGQHPVQAVQALEAWALGHGLKRLAFVTMRPGMLRRMLGMGYGIKRAEIIKELTP